MNMNSSLSFRISRKKLIQHELRNITCLRLVDTDEFDELRVEHPADARRLIETYQLGKSRLLFSIVEINEHGQVVVFQSTSVYSHIMSGDTNNIPDDTLTVTYAPDKGAWSGGDNILMTIPNLDRRRRKLVCSPPSTQLYASSVL